MQPVTIAHFGNELAVLFPQGSIALKERNLLFVLQALMLLVIIPVYILTFIFSWRYRASNTKATYDPDLVDNRLAEYIWWGVPIVMTIIVSVLTWVKSYELDPFRPIESDKKTITVQVVALQWKWLFLYPEEKIATVNLVQFPENTPIHFEITADAPMNSFWIPSLGGQIYAMPSMKTQLHLIADAPGDYRGASANLSGEGFAGMTFIARASTEEEYQKWVKETQQSGKTMNLEKYNELVKPSQDDPEAAFQLKEDKLFEQILHKYMHPQEKT
ncbi:MAG: ubiquinol oxidase subunit II [Parachlamydiaceae bacterium]|nr:ubiquinol oxidase subunit II [Parachlamydiaceae bacterium]